MKSIIQLLAWVLTLKPLEGYRSYIGAVGLLLSGLGSFGGAIAFMLATPPDTEKATAAVVAGIALIAQALAAFGLRKAAEANAAKIEAVGKVAGKLETAVYTASWKASYDAAMAKARSSNPPTLSGESKAP